MSGILCLLPTRMNLLTFDFEYLERSEHKMKRKENSKLGKKKSGMEKIKRV